MGQLSQGAGDETLQAVADRGDVDLVAAFDVVQEGQDEVGPAQQGVQLDVVGPDVLLAQLAEQGFHQMSQLGDVVEGKEAGPALDRVHGPEQTVNAVAQRLLGRFFQGEQVVGDVGQVLLGLADELVDQRVIGGHA